MGQDRLAQDAVAASSLGSIIVKDQIIQFGKDSYRLNLVSGFGLRDLPLPPKPPFPSGVYSCSLGAMLAIIMAMIFFQNTQLPAVGLILLAFATLAFACAWSKVKRWHNWHVGQEMAIFTGFMAPHRL